MFDIAAYDKAIADLRGLLVQIGRREFRAYGYMGQLMQYRKERRAICAA